MGSDDDELVEPEDDELVGSDGDELVGKLLSFSNHNLCSSVGVHPVFVVSKVSNSSVFFFLDCFCGSGVGGVLPSTFPLADFKFELVLSNSNFLARVAITPSPCCGANCLVEGVIKLLPIIPLAAFIKGVSSLVGVVPAVGPLAGFLSTLAFSSVPVVLLALTFLLSSRSGIAVALPLSRSSPWLTTSGC